jgi:hypothetical protein
MGGWSAGWQIKQVIIRKGVSIFGQFTGAMTLEIGACRWIKKIYRGISLHNAPVQDLAAANAREKIKIQNQNTPPQDASLRILFSNAALDKYARRNAPFMNNSACLPRDAHYKMSSEPARQMMVIPRVAGAFRYASLQTRFDV